MKVGSVTQEVTDLVETCAGYAEACFACSRGCFKFPPRILRAVISGTTTTILHPAYLSTPSEDNPSAGSIYRHDLARRRFVLAN